mgnify:CR=1 FL=1
MINNPVMNRDGLIATSGTSDLTRLLADQQSQAAGLGTNMDLFQQRFDQSALPVNIQAEPSGIAQVANSSKKYIQNKLLQKFTNFKPPSIAMMAAMLPPRDPVLDQSRDYFSGLYGLDSIGRIQQGELMAGYNPISGGGLYTISGGKFGDPPTVGLDKAYQKRIDTITNVGIPRLLKAGKDPSNLKSRLDKLIAAQAKDNMALQQIKLANATSQQKQTIKEMKKVKNTGMPEQPTGGGGNDNTYAGGGATLEDAGGTAPGGGYATDYYG